MPNCLQKPSPQISVLVIGGLLCVWTMIFHPRKLQFSIHTCHFSGVQECWVKADRHQFLASVLHSSQQLDTQNNFWISFSQLLPQWRTIVLNWEHELTFSRLPMNCRWYVAKASKNTQSFPAIWCCLFTFFLALSLSPSLSLFFLTLFLLFFLSPPFLLLLSFLSFSVPPPQCHVSWY